MEHLTLGSLWDALTWHTFIEVIAIIIAAFIVHPLTSAAKRSYERVFLRLAASSQRRALNKIKELLDYYAAICGHKHAIEEQLFRAVLRASSRTSKY